MRCECCNTELTEYESSIKGKHSGEYLNSCIKCIKTMDISYIGNKALKKKEQNENQNPYELPEMWEQ